MEEKVPETMFLSVCGSGEDEWLSASKTEADAVKNTDDEDVALVGEYKLVAVRNRRIVTSVVDA